MMRRVRRDEGPYDRNNFGKPSNMRNAEGDERVLRSEPPRQIPFQTKIGVLFGGTVTSLGWLFFTMGFLFMLLVGKSTNLGHIFSFDGEWVQGKGTVLDIQETGTRINDEDVYAFTISYICESQEYQAVSYDYLHKGPGVMGQADIEYKENNPKRGRIVGMREGMVPVWVILIPLVFVLIGGSIAGVAMSKNRKAIKLLEEGLFTRGKLIGSTTTNVRVNNRVVMKYEFSFDDNQGNSHIATCKTHQPHEIEDEGLEIILYNKDNPEHSIVYDGTPGVPKINDEGHFDNGNPRALFYLLFPLVAFGGGLAILLF